MGSLVTKQPLCIAVIVADWEDEWSCKMCVRGIDCSFGFSDFPNKF